MERKIYNGWAFSENEDEKGKINYSIYQELMEKFKVYRSDLRFVPEVNSDEWDVVIGRRAEYLHADYNIIKNQPNLSTNELLLLCDGGNLCFGGRCIGNNQLQVSED